MVFGPIGGRIEIQGIQAFRQAKNEVIRGFAQINRSVKSVGTAALPTISGGARGGLYAGGRVGGLGVYQRLPVQLGIAGVAIGAVTVAVEKLGAEFERTSNQVKVFGNATESETAALSKAAINMSRSFVAGANDIGQAAVTLGKAGAPVADLSNQLLKATVVFNQASQGEVTAADAGDLLVQTVTALGLSYSDALPIVDAYVGAVQSSTLTFGELTTQLKTTLPIAGALDYTYEELATTLALLSQNGLRGSIAGTTLKNALLALADPSKEALEILQKYNISLFDANGKALPLIEVLGRLEAAFGRTNEGVSDAQKFFEQSDIFNTRQILAALALVNQGTAGYERMLVAVRNVSSEQIAQDLQNNVIDQLKLVGNNLTANALIAANEFQPTITRALQAINQELRNTGEDGARSFGMAINQAISLSNQDLNLFLAQVIGVAGGVEEAVLIIQEQFLQLNTDINVSVESINIDLEKIPQSANNASRGTRIALVGLGDEFSKTAALAGNILGNIATNVVFLGKVLSGGTKASAQATGEIANQTHHQVNIVDAAIARMIHNLNLGIRAINTFLGAISALTGSTLRVSEIANVFPDVAAAMQDAKDEVAAIGAQISSVTDDVINAANVGIQTVGETIVAVENTADRVTRRVDRDIGSALERIKRIQAILRPGMPNDMGFWDRIGGAPAPVIPRVTGGGGSTFPSAGGSSGGGAKAEDVDKLAARIREMLRDVPALTQELTEFIAGIAKDFPERLQPMVSALIASRGEIGQLVLLKRDMLQIDLQLIASEQRLTALEAEQGRLSIQQAIAVIGYDKQLLGLRQQMLEIDHQMNPLRDKLLMIEREMSRLQQENLALTRQRIAVELAILPIREEVARLDREIADTQRVNYAAARDRLNLELKLLEPRREIVAIDRQINDLQRKNFDLERSRVQDEIASLPIRKQIRDIERQITDSVDQRAGIQRRLQELDLADVEDNLAAAWAKMDVPTILRLEEQKIAIEKSLEGNEAGERAAERKRLGLELEKVALEETLDPIERRLQAITDTKTETELLNELTLLGLEEQKQAIEDVMLAIQDRIDQIASEEERRRILNEITKIGLEEERQAILDQLEPLELRLAAINAQATAEQLRAQLAITYLEEERRQIIEQLQPLEDQRRAIERITQEIDILRARAALEFEERKIGIQEMILNEQLRQAELLETKRQQNALFQDLVLGFINSLAASEAFTLDESLEVAQRLRLWNDQIAKLAETVVEFTRLDRAAEDAASAIRSIERDVTVTITTVHRTVYESAPAPATTADPGVPAFARGGVVPGPRGAPILALVHGGEVINSVTNNRVPESVRAREGALINRGTINYISETNYNLSPNYQNYQSPASISDDIRALQMMTSR